MSDSVGSVSVDVVPDARGWSEKLRAQIRDQTATVNVDADTGEAEAQIDEVARDRKATVEIDTDRSKLSETNSLLGSFVDKLGLLPAVAVAAGAAAVPLAASLAGVTAALAAPLLIAGGGATLFAFLGGFAVKQTQTQLKNIDALDKKLSGLTKGTKEYTQTQRQLRDAQAALSPGQKAFAASLEDVQSTFAKMLRGKTGEALLGPFTQGLELLNHLLPVASPLLVAVSGALTTLLDDLDRGAQSKGFERFVDQVARLAGRDLVEGGHILGNLAGGVAGLLVALDRHAGGSLLKTLDSLTANFDHWANSKAARDDVRSFLGYFHDVGPQVAHTIGAVAHALGEVVKALAPLGPPVLKGIELAANAIADIPTPVLTGLAAATIGLTAAGEVGQGVSKLTGGRLLGGGLTGGVLGGKGVVPVYVTNPGFGGGPGGLPGGGGGTGFLGGLRTILGGATLGGALLYGGDQLSRAEGKSPLIALPAILGVAVQEMRTTNKLLSGSGHLGPLGLPLASDPRQIGPKMFGSQVVGGTQGLKSTTNVLDAVNAGIARVSRGYDVMGHSAAANSASAVHALHGVQIELGNIHDKKIQVIAQTADAIRNLERLQAYRIQNKYFTVYQRSQQLDRTVAPGGGMGQNPHGSGPPTRSGDNGGGRQPVNLHVADQKFEAWMDQRMDQTYHANRAFESTAAGR